MKLAILSCQHLSIFSSAACLLSVEQIHASLVLNISCSPLWFGCKWWNPFLVEWLFTPAFFLGYSARNVILTSAGPHHRLRMETPAYLQTLCRHVTESCLAIGFYAHLCQMRALLHFCVVYVLSICFLFETV